LHDANKLKQRALLALASATDASLHAFDIGKLIVRNGVMDRMRGIRPAHHDLQARPPGFSCSRSNESDIAFSKQNYFLFTFWDDC